MFIYSTTLMNNKLFQHYIFKISLYHLIRTLINLYHSWYFSTHSTLSILIKLVSTWMTTNIFRHIYSLCVRLKRTRLQDDQRRGGYWFLMRYYTRRWRRHRPVRWYILIGNLIPVLFLYYYYYYIFRGIWVIRII